MDFMAVAPQVQVDQVSRKRRKDHKKRPSPNYVNTCGPDYRLNCSLRAARILPIPLQELS
jgi:hypothetical protein